MKTTCVLALLLSPAMPSASVIAAEPPRPNVRSDASAGSEPRAERQTRAERGSPATPESETKTKQDERRLFQAQELITALPEAMRVLTSPAETGAVTLALPLAFEAKEPLRLEDFPGRPESIRLTTAEPGDAVWAAKRLFDIVISSMALVLVAPIIGIAAAAIKLDSPGPVFFLQERIGQNRRRGDRRSNCRAKTVENRAGTDRRKSEYPGRPFRIYKLRTMIADAEQCGPSLARERDPRITRVGRFLRKTRIDELPQFLNVMRGEMSIIGPRPERLFFIDQARREIPHFTARLLVKPGITGLAQVENGYTSSIGEMRHKLFYDLTYISNFSIWQEIRILLKTLYVVAPGKGAC